MIKHDTRIILYSSSADRSFSPKPYTLDLENIECTVSAGVRGNVRCVCFPNTGFVSQRHLLYQHVLLFEHKACKSENITQGVFCRSHVPVGATYPLGPRTRRGRNQNILFEHEGSRSISFFLCYYIIMIIIIVVFYYYYYYYYYHYYDSNCSFFGCSFTGTNSCLTFRSSDVKLSRRGASEFQILDGCKKRAAQS